MTVYSKKTVENRNSYTVPNNKNSIVIKDVELKLNKVSDNHILFKNGFKNDYIRKVFVNCLGLSLIIYWIFVCT